MSRLTPTMGGKRQTRRCMSLLDEKEAKPFLISHDDATTTTTAPTNHVTAFCPIAIQIDECQSSSSDSEENESKDWSREELSAGKAINHGLSPSPPQHKAFQTVFGTTLGCKPLPSHSHRGSITLLDVPENSELSTLKATAVRLNLRTRTSSFMEWQAKWLDNSRAPPQFPLPAEEGSGGSGGGGQGGDRLTSERKERISEALDWLKTELREMRSMDQHLARQLLSLRHDIHQLRLRRSCQEHRDLLDDVQSELEEQVELSDVLDLPNDLSLNDTPLKQIGVTRMNISRRRFSMC